MSKKDFEKVRWDCDICPLYPCPYVGTMLTEDCFDDVMAFWKKADIVPEYGFTVCVESRGYSTSTLLFFRIKLINEKSRFFKK